MKARHILLLSAAIAISSWLCSLNAQTVLQEEDFGSATMTAASPAELITGQISGVLISSYSGNPNGAMNTSIRGVNSLRGDNQPLWIVDGAILGNASAQNLEAFSQFGEKSRLDPLNPLAFLSPYDIESIEVLKDASATALYGIRGANGVIIIRTAKSRMAGSSKTGQGSSKTGQGNGNEGGIKWRSNISWDGGFQHNHYLATAGEINRFTYNISGFFRNVNGSVERNSSNSGSIKLNMETCSNDIIHLGVNTLLNLGKTSVPSATAYFGEGSLTMAMRDPSLSQGFTREDWAADFDDDTKEYRTVNSVYMDINFLPVLKWRTTLGADFSNINRYVWYGDRTPFGKEENGAAAILNSTLFRYNLSSLLEYSQFVGADHRISATAGAELIGDVNSFNTMNGTDFFSKTLRAHGLSLMKSDVKLQKYNCRYFEWGVLASLGYSYKDIVGANAALRSDFTMKYGNAPQLYPTASLWWNIIPSVKVEGGYGITGRELAVPYDLTSRYLTGSYPNVDADTAVYWDGLNRVRSSEWHAGIETSFWAKRLNVGVKYYDRTSEDSYLMYSFCERPGKYLRKGPRELQYSRSATVRNRGVEIDAEAVPVKSGNVIWKIRLNATYNINRVTEATDEDMFGPSIGSGLVASGHRKGYAASAILGYGTDPDNELSDLDGDGKITSADMKVIGETQPLWYTSLSSTISWKGLTAGFLLTAAGGNDLVNLNTLALNNEKELHAGYVEKGDYLKLSQLWISYGIPVRWKWLKKLSVSISGNNLFTLSRYSGYSPDVNSFGTSMLSCGFDYGSYPQIRAVTLGVSANF